MKHWVLVLKRIRIGNTCSTLWLLCFTISRFLLDMTFVCTTCFFFLQIWRTEACFPLRLTLPFVIQNVSKWEEQCGFCIWIFSTQYQCTSQSRWSEKARYSLWCYCFSGRSAISGSQSCACSLQQLLPFKNCGPGGCWSYHHFTGRGKCYSLLSVVPANASNLFCWVLSYSRLVLNWEVRARDLRTEGKEFLSCEAAVGWGKG